MSLKSTIVRLIQVSASLSSRVSPGLAASGLQKLFTTPMKVRRPSREQEWMEGSRRAWVPFDESRRMPMYIWGEEEAPTVLLVHGWAGRGSQLGGFVQPLLEQGYRVVSFDMPAHGEADGRQTTVPEMAVAVEKMAEAIEATSPLHGIIAHSMGTSATSIAISNGVTPKSVVYIAPPENLRMYLYRLGEQLGFSQHVIERVQLRLEEEYGASFEDARGAKLAPLMQSPLWVAHDKDDRDVPFEEGAALVSVWPGAQLYSTSGEGHNRILRSQEVLKGAVQFLTQQQFGPSLTLGRA